ncbi:MAG: hypothetical protein ACR2M3_14200 [Thermomicrobiales bacterium]
MNAQPDELSAHPHDEADYAALARDVRYLKAAVATIAARIAHRDPIVLSQVEGDKDNEEQAILAHLTGAVSPSEQGEARAALDAFTDLVHAVSAENSLTESELADRFDASRRTASSRR